MKKILLTLVTFGLIGTMVAQDEAIFNHYVQSPIILNPAAVGFGDEYELQLSARAAWSGFVDSPKTIAARLNGPVGNSFGIGGTLFSESAAQQNRLKGKLDVAFRFGFGPQTRKVYDFQMAFGFYTQFERITVNSSILNNPLIQQGDEVLLNYIEGENRFDAGVGIYASYKKNTFGGLTINNLVSNRLDNISGESTEGNFNYTFLLGQRIQVGEDVQITPSIMLRDVQGAPQMFDLNLQAGFLDNKLITGLSYRNLGALGLLLGTELDGFHFYYSYDLSFADFQAYSNGSHEITVGYRINRVELKKQRENKAKEQIR